MTYRLRFTASALNDLKRHRKSGDIKILKKIEVLLNELREDPKTGTGKPKRLRHDLDGLYSRRINSKHRLVYDIKDEIVTVIVLSAFAHYADK